MPWEHGDAGNVSSCDKDGDDSEGIGVFTHETGIALRRSRGNI